MAKGLKCWKKVGYSSDGALYEKELHGGFVEIERGKIKGKVGWVIYSPSNKKLGIKTNKQQALKFAKSYMKKHDKC